MSLSRSWKLVSVSLSWVLRSEMARFQGFISVERRANRAAGGYVRYGFVDSSKAVGSWYGL